MPKNAIFFGLLWSILTLSVSSCTLVQPLESTGSTTTAVSSDREQVTDYAQKFKGTKYVYAGRSPKGFDCSGFTHYVMDEIGVELTPVSRVQETEGRPIDLEDAQPGDLIFFRKTRNGKVFHVALVLANEPDGIYVIHSTSSRGVVVDNITTNSYWKEKYQTARDVIGR